MYSIVGKIVGHSHPDIFSREFNIMKQKKIFFNVICDKKNTVNV